jgi:uncharacterized protein (TIGR00369 family)
VSAAPSSRRRVVEWDDPTQLAPALRTLSGLEFLRAILRGELPPPPITKLVGFELESVDTGRVVFAFEPREEHYNPASSVHGGILSVLLDSAMGCAVQSTQPPGSLCTTLEIKANFVRSVTIASGRLLCEGRVVHAGTKTATAEGFLRDAEGRLHAHATTTCLLLS